MENGDHLIPEQLDPGPPSPCKPGLYPNHNKCSLVIPSRGGSPCEDGGKTKSIDMREGFIAKRAMHCVGVVPEPMLPAPMHVKGESSGGGDDVVGEKHEQNKLTFISV